MAVKYKILEKTADPLDSVIEISGLTDTSTLREIYSNIGKAEQKVKEFESQIQLCKAAIENAEHFHPAVKELDEKMLDAAGVIFSQKRAIKTAEENIKAYLPAIEHDKKMAKEILEKTGLTLLKN